MNIDDMKFGDIKKIAAMFSSAESSANTFLQDYLGKYVICRTRNEGINAGVVVEIDETGVVLDDARRIYYHKPKDSSLSWYEGVAQSGLHQESKISGPVKKIIIEDYSLTVCSDVAEKSIREFLTNES
jgi:hypothetical protein